MIRRNLTHQRRHALHVATSNNKRAQRRFGWSNEGSGDEAVDLAEHLNAATTCIGVRLNPDTLLLVSPGRISVLFTQLVRPSNALTFHAECEGALTAVTSDNVRQGVGLCTVDRRVGAVSVTELCVNRYAIQWDVTVREGGARVTLEAIQVHVTGNKALTHTVRVSKVSSFGHTATSNRISIDNLIGLSWSVSLRNRSWQRHLHLDNNRARGRQHQYCRCTSNGLHLVGETERECARSGVTSLTASQISHIVSFQKTKMRVWAGFEQSGVTQREVVPGIQIAVTRVTSWSPVPRK